MTWLEYIGILGILLFLANLIYMSKKSDKKDPLQNRRMEILLNTNRSFEKLRVLRDKDFGEYNEAISNIQIALDSVITNTYPMPSNTETYDFQALYVNYEVIYYLANQAIENIKKSTPMGEKEFCIQTYR